MKNCVFTAIYLFIYSLQYTEEYIILLTFLHDVGQLKLNKCYQSHTIKA